MWIQIPPVTPGRFVQVYQRFVSSVEERPPVERTVSGSNPLRSANFLDIINQGSVAQWQSTRLITGSAMVRSHPEPPTRISCRVAQRESRRSITVRSSVRSGPRQPFLYQPTMRPWRNRDTRESQKLVSIVTCRFDPCRAHHTTTSRA